MTPALWAGLLLWVGPWLDPIGGERVLADWRDVVPTARHLGDVGDMFFIELMEQQNSGGGGIELFDPLRLSAYGLSWSQLHYTLGGLDITDPAMPGQPLIDLPYTSWNSLELQTLWTDVPGFAWTIQPQGMPNISVTGRGGGEVNGGFWLPGNVFDRDPSTPYGSPEARRALRSAAEVVAQGDLNVPWGALRFNIEGVRHLHRYLTLSPLEQAERLTAVLTTQSRKNATPWELTALWQGQHRGFEGAEFRFPRSLTQDTLSQGAVLQGAVTLGSAKDRHVRLAVGGGWRNQWQQAPRETPQVTDIEGEWLYMARPSFPRDIGRWRIDAAAVGQLDDSWRLTSRLSTQHIDTTTKIPGNLSGLTYGGVPERLVAWSGSPAQEGFEVWRTDLHFTHQWEDLWLEAVLGLDAVSVHAAAAVAPPRFLSPGGGLAARLTVAGGELFALVRREPEAFTAQLAQFVNGATPFGTVHSWEDLNNDGVPQASEAGELLSVTGGATHDVVEGLRRPSNNQLAIGYKTAPLGPFRVILQGVGRWLMDRYTVHLADPQEHPTPFAGATDEPDLQTVYAQAPASFGAERYVLDNDSDATFFLGTELQLMSEGHHWWFLNLTAAAYITKGNAPFGAFPDRNDPGVINEASATANERIHSYGRYDFDRSFTIKLLAGMTPREDLSIALAARYRDGQPFTRIAVATGLPQGPTPIMAMWRGQVRHTFNMIWDVRVRYELPLEPFKLTCTLDIFNFWGSDTELLEDSRASGAWRRSIEAVPDRSLMVSLAATWNLPGDHASATCL